MPYFLRCLAWVLNCLITCANTSYHYRDLPGIIISYE